MSMIQSVRIDLKKDPDSEKVDALVERLKGLSVTDIMRGKSSIIFELPNGTTAEKMAETMEGMMDVVKTACVFLEEEDIAV